MPIKSATLMEKFCLSIDCLDYKYIEKCSNVKEIENILRVLRSGEEGVYPHLTKFCEHRLQELSPNNKLLQIQGHISSAADFPREEWKEFQDDVEDWVKEVNDQETNLMATKSGKIDDLYRNIPIRNISSPKQISESNKVENLSNERKSVRVKSYKELDEYNVDEQLKKIDEENHKETVSKKVKPCLDFSMHVEDLSESERKYIAGNEKVKGNEAFKIAELKEAFMYYSRSISAFPTVAAYNNRAQTNIKLKNYGAALFDCNKVLQIDPNNVKALFRRGIAYKEKGALIWACKDFRKLLQLDPGNKFANNYLEEAEKNIISKNPKETGTRVLIEETDECTNETLKENITSNKKVDKSEGNLNEEAFGGIKNAEMPNGIIDNYSNNVENIDIDPKTVVKGKTSNNLETQTSSGENNTKFEINNDYMSKDSKYLKENLPKASSEISKNIKVSKISENYLNEEHCNNKKSGILERVLESNGSVSSIPTYPSHSHSSSDVSDNINNILKVRNDDTDEDSEKNYVLHSTTANKQFDYKSQISDNCTEFSHENNDFGEQRSTLISNKDCVSFIGDYKHDIIVGEHHSYDSREIPNEMKINKGIKNLLFKNSLNQESRANVSTLPEKIHLATDPITPFEFLHQWHSQKAGKNYQTGAALLSRIKPDQLPTILTNKLDGDFLCEIINAIFYLAQSGNYQQGYAFLCSLAKVPRISTVALFLSSQEKKEISVLLTELMKQDKELDEQRHEEVTNIKEKFCLN